MIPPAALGAGWGLCHGRGRDSGFVSMRRIARRIGAASDAIAVSEINSMPFLMMRRRTREDRMPAKASL